MNILEKFSLKGKVVVLTGGAGKYGRQITDALAEAGATLVLASRNLKALEAVAAEECAKGFPVSARALDLGCDESIEALHAAVVAEHGAADVLVNNAVTRSAAGGGWDQPLDDFDRSLRVNVSGLFRITHLFSREMIERKAGSIINIGSMMGMVGPEMANYEGTDMGRNPSPIYFFEKAGMIGFTRWAASLLGPYNIRVNCVSPGGLWQPSMPERFVRQYSARTQLGRLANETDVKGVIVFLASDASAYITGTNIPVDGGYTAK